jgi:hypothetical protein
VESGGLDVEPGAAALGPQLRAMLGGRLPQAAGQDMMASLVNLLSIGFGVFGLVAILMGWNTLHERDWRTGEDVVHTTRETVQAYGWIGLGSVVFLSAFWLAR